MKFNRDETDRFANMLEWIENGDHYAMDSQIERLVTVVNGFLGYKERTPAYMIDLNPSYSRIRFDDIQEGDSTFKVYWEVGGKFTLWEISDSSLDDEPWDTATKPLELIEQ